MQYDHLLNHIYDTIADPYAWKAFNAELARLIDATTMHLLAFDKKHEVFSFSDGFNVELTGELEYIRRRHRDDPRLALIWPSPASRWFHCDDYFDEAFVAGNAFFQEFAIPAGRRYASACKLVDDDAVTVLLACTRTAQQGPLPADARTLLERLTPHLARAANLQAARYVFSTDTVAGHPFPNRWLQPAMLVSTGGELLRINDPARQLLDATSLVRVHGRCVTLRAPHHEHFLADVATSEARLHSRQAGALAEAARFRVIRIVEDAHGSAAHEGGQEVLYAFYNVVVPGDDGSPPSGMRPVAMLIFYHPRSAPPVDETLLAAAFDLTPAECRIAHLLAEGLTQKEIAARVGVQHDTVRKQLQSIFQKTSTRRQPDLLRLLLHLPGLRGPASGAD